jgi:glycosyltransferase involved in cell wall biosynthesis
MRIVYITAGAAGMYCGSCLHDNALAKALRLRGHDAMLIPTYTPIQTDQPNASQHRLFYGGLNVYLQQVSPVFRWIPKWADAFLSRPGLVSWIASRAMGTSAENLGALTISMLKGEQGNQAKEVDRLCQWLKSLNPDVVIFTNLLIAGAIPGIRRVLPRTRQVVMLQGDDIFYDGLIEPYRSQALVELRRLAGQVDLFLLHSCDYQSRMSGLLQQPADRMRVCPLSVDADDLLQIDRSDPSGPLKTVGYLARIAPEKGLHLLVDSFIELVRQSESQAFRLLIAGWQGKQHQAYWDSLQTKLEQAGLAQRYEYWCTIDRQQKQQFLSQIDLLTVPTTYADPKGLFALEAMAAGVPYLLPCHGTFPELHQRAQAGQLHQPGSVADLTSKLKQMLDQPESLRRLGQRGRQYVRTEASVDHEAQAIEASLNTLT